MEMATVRTTRKILVADDSAVVVAMLKNILKAAGYEVVTAGDGIEATQRVYSEAPDLILLDIFMPRMNGYQVCRLLKSDAAVAHIPVIILTAADGGNAQFWSLQTGADGFMIKGFASEELLAVVAQHLPAEPARIPQSATYAPGPEEILSKVQLAHGSGALRHHRAAHRIENNSAKPARRRADPRHEPQNHQRQSVPAQDARRAGRRSARARRRGSAGRGSRARSHWSLSRQHWPAMMASSRDSVIHNRDGTTTPVSINATVLRDYLNKTVGCVCLFQDITRRKQVEELNRLKNDLTAMIVHDLRTPLTSLLSGLQTVELLGDLNEDQQEFLRHRPLKAGKSLLGMINDLLDIEQDGGRLVQAAITQSFRCKI